MLMLIAHTLAAQTFFSTGALILTAQAIRPCAGQELCQIRSSRHHRRQCNADSLPSSAGDGHAEGLA